MMPFDCQLASKLMKSRVLLSRHPIRKLFFLALTTRVAFLILNREDWISLQADEPWDAQRISTNLGEPTSDLQSSRRRVVVYWHHVLDEELHQSSTIAETHTLLGTNHSSSAATRKVEPLGVGNVWDESFYESKKYYWNDPSWSRQDSVQFYPTCNNLHELDLSVPNTVELLPSGGSFRLSALYHPQQQQQLIQLQDQQQHLRMIHYGRPWTRADMIKGMNDATAMQNVQASPWVVQIYNACGLSLTSEFMAGGTLTSQLAVPPRANGRKLEYFPMERLGYAIQTAKAVADVHAANMVHMDIYVKNLMLDDQGQVHLNDFNLARLLPPIAPASSSSSQRQDQDHLRTTMKKNWQHDMFMLGKVLYTIRTGRLLQKDLDGIWRKAAANNTTGRHANETDNTLIGEKVGVRGFNFSSLEEGKTSHRANLALSTLEWCISACLQPILPADRPTAQQLRTALEGAQEAILRHPETNSSSLQDLQQIVDDHLHGSVLVHDILDDGKEK
jgi:hypothetical protein